MIKSDLIKLLGISHEDLERPTNPNFGDFSTNIALKKQIDPEEFIKQIPKNDIIEKIEVVGKFINFWIKKDLLLEELKSISEEKENYGRHSLKNFKILLEFGQPNTHKIPHIGHLFSYIYGESLSRILDFYGNDVTRLNYQGDVGLNVAKCLFVARNKIQEIKNKELEEKVQFLQQCYQEGSELYETDPNAKNNIHNLNLKIYHKDPEIIEIWKETRDWCVEFYKLFEKRLGTNYNKWYFESETAEVGKKIVEDNKSIFEESDGAVIFRGEEYGLHTRVFINKFGIPTYEAKDIGLMSFKKNDYPFDLSIVTTASEQNDYWKVVIKAAELLFPQLVGKLKHIGYGLISLTGGKMSSRKGEIVDAFSLVDDVKNKIIKEYKAQENLAEKVSLSAIKYSFLKSEFAKNIIFDIASSVAREGESGPYILYTYVRTQSVLEKVENYELRITNYEFNSEELALLRKLSQFPEVIENAARLYSPHLVAHFIYNLAKDFNLFYQKHQIIKATEEAKQFRIALTAAVGQVIKNGLYLLGIDTVSKM